MSAKKIAIFLMLALALALNACAPAAAPTEAAQPAEEQPAVAEEPTEAAAEEPTAPAEEPAAPAEEPAAGDEVTITVWDLYGDTTPIKPLIPAFEAENPGIKVKFEEVGWDGFWQKLPIAISSGEVPDVVTTGLMWAPEYKVSGAYADVMPLSEGKLNGEAFEDVLPKGSLEAAKDGDKVYGIPYDFDAYALYYRADLFEAAGVTEIPTTWEGMADAFAKVADPDNGVYGVAVDPSWNGWDSYLYAFGGTYLDESGKAAFNSPEAVASLNFMKSMVANNSAIVWTPDMGDLVSAVKSGTVASFINGPYMMGVLRTAAPELSGKWKIAMLPTEGDAFGTHIGGVHLSIMEKSQHQAEAWKLIEFLARTENQVNVWKTSGAAPALLPALENEEVTQPDPYFSDQAPISIFKDTIQMGTPNPTIAEWTQISEIVTKAVTAIMTTDADVQATLDEAVAKANEVMGK